VAFTTCSVVTNNIASLDNLPNDVGGLTATQLKALFDKFGADFVAWFNATHLVEGDAHLADLVTDANGAHGLIVKNGNWTPTLYGSTTAGAHTYVTQAGTYIKINNKVTCFGMITLSAKDAAMSGDVRIGGLPFAVFIDYLGAVSFGGISYIDHAADEKRLIGAAMPNTTYCRLAFERDNAIQTNLQPAQVQNNTTLTFCIEYIATS